MPRVTDHVTQRQQAVTPAPSLDTCTNFSREPGAGSRVGRTRPKKTLMTKIPSWPREGGEEEAEEEAEEESGGARGRGS